MKIVKTGLFNSITNRLYAKSSEICLIVLIIITMISCDNTQTNDSTQGGKIERNNYTIEPIKANRFYVLYSSLDDNKLPRNIEYLLNGTIQNNTGNTYAKGYLTMQLSLILENGKTIEEKDMQNALASNLPGFQTFRDWKPNEKIDIKELYSISIPVEYAGYPVKDVVIEYVLDAEDQINQTHEKNVIQTESAVESWKQAVANVKANNVEVSDDDFPRKIIERSR